MNVTPELACRLDMSLGEGPLWSPAEQALWFVDIKRGRLHRFDPANGTCATHEVGGKPSFALPAEGGGLVVGSERALYRFDGAALSAPLAEIAMPAHNRTNDGTVGPDGRLWFGTMDDEEQVPTGAVYSFASGELEETNLRAVVTNGPAVSADGKWLYHVDSGERTIWRIALADGRLEGEGEVFVRLTEREGFPDGVTLDAEGCLWVALWDGWAVRRYSPAGELLLQIDMPCARPTKVAFGGADLRTCYVTSARVGLDGGALAEQPLAGSLFSFPAPAPGLPSPAARLD